MIPVTKSRKLEVFKIEGQNTFNSREIITNLEKKLILKEGVIKSSLYKSATQQNLLYHIQQIHSLACQQGSYQCRAVLLDTKVLEADPLNWLNMISKDFHHLTLSQKADLTVPVNSELVQEEIWDLKQNLLKAMQSFYPIKKMSLMLS